MPVSYTLLLHPKFRSFLVDGTLNIGGKVYTYEAGTTTPAKTYQDATLTTANTNPVILDANGQADIFYSGHYKIVVCDANGVQLYSADNLFGAMSPEICSFPVQDNDKLIAWDDVDGKLKNSNMTLFDIELAANSVLTFAERAEAALAEVEAAYPLMLSATDAANAAAAAALKLTKLNIRTFFWSQQ